MRRAFHQAVLVVAAFMAVTSWFKVDSVAQTAYIGSQARQSVGAVFLEFVRYEGSNVAERSLRFNGTAWAAKSGPTGTWWVTNAHVAKVGGYPPPKPVLDRHGRWWYPTGRQAIKTRDGRVLFPGRIIADGSLDLAGLSTAYRYEAIPSSDESVAPPHRIVVVGYPLSYRSVVSEGRVMQEAGGGFDEGSIPEKDDDCAPDGPKLKASLFLHDAVTTFGGSGSPVISLETGMVIGVARGFYIAGNCIISTGPSLQYAISGRDLLQFLRRIP